MPWVCIWLVGALLLIVWLWWESGKKELTQAITPYCGDCNRGSCKGCTFVETERER